MMSSSLTNPSFPIERVVTSVGYLGSTVSAIDQLEEIFTSVLNVSHNFAMSKPIQTCVLGVGLAGLTFHVPFILALSDIFTLHSVLERNPQSEGGKVKDRFGVNVKIHRSLDEVLADSGVELVIVGTPNETHYAFAKAALAAGKHGKHPPLGVWHLGSCFLFAPSPCRQACNSYIGAGERARKTGQGEEFGAIRLPEPSF
jgi:hypothetical protein